MFKDSNPPSAGFPGPGTSLLSLIFLILYYQTFNWMISNRRWRGIFEEGCSLPRSRSQSHCVQRLPSKCQGIRRHLLAAEIQCLQIFCLGNFPPGFYAGKATFIILDIYSHLKFLILTSSLYLEQREHHEVSLQLRNVGAHKPKALHGTACHLLASHGCFPHGSADGTEVPDLGRP